MRNFLRSLFGRRDDASAVEPPPASRSNRPAPEAVEEPESIALRPARSFAPAGSVSDILAGLVAVVCETMPDIRSADEIDPEVHMYDAGYVTSITAADLLVHIDRRYGLDISETQLIGPLQNLAALSAYIHAHAGSRPPAS